VSVVPYASRQRITDERRAELDRRMDALRGLQRALDEAFRVPGTNFRFGWDPLIGLVPWIGDALTALMSCAIIVQAHHMRVPRIVQLHMLLNVAIDLVAGVIPLVGDLLDFAWKSNTKNMALLERHAVEVRPPTRGDWLFVVGVVLTVIGIALVPLLVVYWLVHAVPGPRFHWF
jgi:hypothetical protein